MPAPTVMLPASELAVTAWLVSIVTPSEVKLSDCFTPAVTPDWAKRGSAHLFHSTILQADDGCDFDFMTREGKG